MEHLTKKQIFISRIILGTLLLLSGIFLLICSFTPLSIKKLILPSVLGFTGLSLLCLSFVQDNTLFLWLSAPALIACLVTILSSFTSYGYGDFYPLYILSPAVGSLITAAYSREFSTHLKVIAAFAPLSGIFMLHSLAKISLKVVAPVGIIYFSLVLIAYSVIRSKE